MAQTIARAVLELVTDSAAHLREIEKAKKAHKGLAADLNVIGKDMQSWGGTMTKSITAPILGGAAALVVLEDKLGDSFDIIRLGTGATGTALDGLNDSFRKVGAAVPDDLGLVATAIADLNTRTGATGPQLEELATQVLTLSRITKTDLGENIRASTRLFGDWAIASGDQATALDTVFKTAQATGIGVTELMDKVVQFGAPLRQMNFSFEESVALLGKWEKEGVNSELVLGSLRIAMGQFAKENIPMRQGLEDTIRKIQELGPGAEATSLSMKTFGARAGPDMAAAILEGRFEIDALMKTIGDSPETIKAAAESTDGLKEEFAKLGNEVMLAAEPMATEFVRILQNDVLPLVKDGIAFLGDLVRWFADLPGPVKTASVVLGGVLALAGPGLVAAGFAISGAGTALAAMGVGGKTAATGVVAADSALKKLLVTLTANPIGLTLLTLGTGFMIAKGDMDAFHANLDRQDAIVKDASLNLTAYGKSIRDAQPPVVDFSFATGGLSVNVEKTGVAAGRATPPVVGLAKATKDLKAALPGVSDADNVLRWMESVEVRADALTQTLPGLTAGFFDFFEQIEARSDDLGLQFLPTPEVTAQQVQEWMASVSVAGQAPSKKSGEQIGMTFGQAFGQAVSGLGPVIVGALQGGGDVWRAAGAHLGSQLGDHMAKEIQKRVSGKLGSLLAGFAGPLGAILGDLGGKLLSKIVGGNNTKKAREQAAQMMGFPSLAAMYDALRANGAEGAKLAHEGLNVIGKNDTAANNAWLQSVEALLSKQKDLTAELEAQREAARELIPSWREAGALAEEYGVSLTEIDAAVRQGELTDLATKLYTDFERLGAFLKDDMNEGVLRGMSDEFSGLIAQALEFGGELPSELQPVVARMREMGLLVNANGEAFTDAELDGLTFADTMEQATRDLIATMKELVEVLKGGVTKAIEGIGGAMRDLPSSLDFDVRPNFGRGDGGEKDPGFATGTPHRDFLNFGRQTRVNLHGDEAVIPRGGGHELAGEIAASLMRFGGGASSRPLEVTVISKLDGRTVARNQQRYTIEELNRVGALA